MNEQRSRWVLITKASEVYGYSEEAIRTKTKRGIWRHGEVWLRAPDGRVIINLDAVDAWLLRARRVTGR